MKHTITLLPGDGIGPEVSDAVVRVLSATGLDIEWERRLAGVDAVNAHLAQYETIKRFVVLPGDFSVEGGELTPTQKVKRKAVSEKYAAEIAALYDAGQ